MSQQAHESTGLASGEGGDRGLWQILRSPEKEEGLACSERETQRCSQHALAQMLEMSDRDCLGCSLGRRESSFAQERSSTDFSVRMPSS